MKQTQKITQKNAQKIQINALDEDQEQELLKKLVKRGVLELKPTLDKKGIRYVEAEDTWKHAKPDKVKSALKNLEKKGDLTPKFADRVLTCPDCSSPEVYSKYACPKCNSINVEYTELLEHMKCGYIGSKNKFKKDSTLVCPGCQAELKEDSTQYRVIGNSYQCEKCGYRFDTPKIVHTCQQCKRNFTHRDAEYIKIYTYKIADKTINKLGKDLPLLDNIEKILREKDFDTQYHAQLTGTSGVQHLFDIVAKRNGVLLVADISITGDKNDAVSLLGKKMDVNPTHTLLIDLSDHKELLPLGKIYNITIVKSGDEKQLEKELRDFLATLDSNKDQKVTNTREKKNRNLKSPAHSHLPPSNFQHTPPNKL